MSKKIDSIVRHECLRWKIIKDFPNYQVSNKGNIKNIKRGKELMPRNNGKGYYTVVLYRKGIKKNLRVHRLVAECFIPNPLNLTTVNHINFNKSDNRVMNLEWASFRENNCHRFKDKIIESMYVGVTLNKRTNKWVSQIGFKGETMHLGTFDTELEAYKCRVEYEKKNNIINKYL